MDHILYILDKVLWMIIIIPSLYLFYFAVASLFFRNKRFGRSDVHNRFLVIFPAYKEDKVIVGSVRSFVMQDYPTDKYEVIVVSDNMLEQTNLMLSAIDGVRVVKAGYSNSSKARALRLAVGGMNVNDYDGVVILDADNIVDSDFLSNVNDAFSAGCRAVQAHRTSLPAHGSVSLLDGLSEEINNSIFRRGHVASGLSSALIGSGMAFDFEWFVGNVNELNSAGEDRELELLLLSQKIRIEYLDHVMVYDEKVSTAVNFGNQRRRWFGSQLYVMSRSVHKLAEALLRGDVELADKLFQWILPPRLLVMGGTFLFGIVMPLVCYGASCKWWLAMFIQIATFFIATPLVMLRMIRLSTILSLPHLVWVTLTNMFRLKGTGTRFIHTDHGADK